MIGTESAEVVADSTEDNEETQNDGASSASASCEIVEEYDEERMRIILFDGITSTSSTNSTFQNPLIRCRLTKRPTESGRSQWTMKK